MREAFGNPVYLNFIWLAPVLVIFYLLILKRRKALLARFASWPLLERLARGKSLLPSSLWVAGRLSLIVLAVLFSAIALARPRWGFHWEEARREGIDLAIAIDTSRSMLAEDVAPNRLERAKREIEDMIKIAGGDRVSLIGFAGTSFVECPLTLDYSYFLESLKDIDVTIIPRGGTAIAEALNKCVKTLNEKGTKNRAVILITDGEDHEGNVEKAAEAARDAGIKVYTVGIGSQDGVPIPVVGDQGKRTYLKDGNETVLSKLNETVLQQVAETTGGAYVRLGTSGANLATVYTDYIAKAEKTELKEKKIKRHHERFQVFLPGALFCMAIYSLMGER